MSDKLAPLNGAETQELAEIFAHEVRGLELKQRGLVTLQRIGSLDAGAADAEKRYTAVNAKIDQARADLAAAVAAVENAKTKATTEAATILQRARSDAEALIAKVRADAATELATTTDALAAGHAKLAALDARIEKARAALSG